MKKLLLILTAIVLPLTMLAQDEMPYKIKHYADKIKDNGKSLEKEEFSMKPAIVKGKIYNFNPQVVNTQDKMIAKVYINNPFFGNECVAVELNPDHTFEIKVPMTVKYQTVTLDIDSFFYGLVVCAAGKTIEISFDVNDITQHQKLIPYFAGENVDLNYALSLPFYDKFKKELIYNNDTMRKAATFTMLEYKKYILDGHERYSKMVDTMHITKRAKEFMKLMLKYQTAEILSRAFRDLKIWREQFNVVCANPQFQDDINNYYDYPKILDIDHLMMFYTYDMIQIFNIWNWFGDGRIFWENEKFSKSDLNKRDVFQYRVDNMLFDGHLTVKEKDIADAIVEKMKKKDTTRTDEEIAFIKTVEDYIEKHNQKVTEEWKAACGGEGYFCDFGKLYDICCKYIPKGIPVPDALVIEIEKMSNPFYAKYVKAKNAEIRGETEAENERGGYYAHKEGESVADSLLVELLKDNQNKVVLIDFWNTWCGPCRGAIKDMEPMKAEFEDKDVVFMYLADMTSPENEYNELIPTIKGLHHRLPNSDVDALKRKWGFTGIPAYVLIGKDGMVKDFGGSGTDYFRQKINAELEK